MRVQGGPWRRASHRDSVSAVRPSARASCSRLIQSASRSGMSSSRSVWMSFMGCSVRLAPLWQGPGQRSRARGPEDRRKVELQAAIPFHPLFHWVFGCSARQDHRWKASREPSSEPVPGGDPCASVTTLSGEGRLTGVRADSPVLSGPELPEWVVPVAFRRRSTISTETLPTMVEAHGIVLQTRPSAE
jgi:hypothetical protein